MKARKVLGVAILASGLMAGSVTAVQADSTPLPAATKSAAYKAALEQYRIEVIKIAIANRVAMDKYNTDWQNAVAKYYADWKAAIEQYQTLRAVYEAKIVPAVAARKAAVVKADAEFLAAVGIAGATSAQLEAAVKTHHQAMDAAMDAFKAAVATFGEEPVKPVKPVAPGKPAKAEKPEKTPKPEPSKKS